MNREVENGGEGSRSSAVPGGERFPRGARIRRGTEIVALLRSGRRRRFGPLDLVCEERPGTPPRFGVIVPKHRHTIVERNRLKRRLRELGRREVLPALSRCGAPHDVLVRARPEAYRASFDDLRLALSRLTEELCSGAPHSV